MAARFIIALAATVTLGGCASGAIDAVMPDPAPQVPSAEQQIQDQLVAMAAPNQNVGTARLRADDNCYWYSYAGPVETTELPLLTPAGRHICAPAPAPEAVPEAEATVAAAA